MKRSILLMRRILLPTLIALVLSIVIASVGTASPLPAIAQTNSTTTVYLNPPTISGTAIGQNFTINMMIRDAPDIQAWQAGMIFNPDLLECTGFKEGEFLKNVGTTLPIAGTINNTAGVITAYGYTLLGELYASGDGRLAYLTFRVKASGVSDLHLQDVKVSSWIYVGDIAEKIKIPTNILDVYTAVVDTTPHTVVILSNSTGKDKIEIDTRLVEIGSGFSGHSFNLTLEDLSFNVIGPYTGFSEVTIPKTLLPTPTPPRAWGVIINGTARIVEAPTENATHTSLYFTYPKGLNNIHITTRLVSSTISIVLSDDSISSGESVTISGNVTAADNTVREGVNVTIQFRTKGDVEWDTLATVETDSSGIYSHIWEPEETGTYEVKASWPGDIYTIGAESDVLTLKVKGAPGIPMEIVAVVVVVIIAIAAAIYFIKFRKK